MLIDKRGSGHAVRVGQFRPTINVSNSDYRLILALMKETGIHRVYAHKKGSPNGKVRNRYVWSWRLANRDIREWGPKILPFLVIKRRQVELILEYVNFNYRWLTLRKNKKKVEEMKRRKVEIFTEIRALNERGIDNRHLIPEINRIRNEYNAKLKQERGNKSWKELREQETRSQSSKAVFGDRRGRAQLQRS